MWGFIFAAASFASKAIEIYIGYSAAKEKEKDLKRANADRDAILSRQRAAVDEEKKRILTVAARAKIGLLRSRTVTSGGSAESPHRLDNLAVSSSLAGSFDYLELTSKLEGDKQRSASRIRDIEGETPGLGTLLAGAAFGTATGAFAEQAKSEWGKPETAPGTR